MKKITLLILVISYGIAGYCQFPQNFEDPLVTPPNVFPTGWLVTDNGVGLSASWSIVNNASVVISGTKSALINRHQNGAGNTSEDWLISPPTTIPANGQLRFLTKTTRPGDEGTLYQIRISSSSDQTNLGAYTQLIQWTETTLNEVVNIADEKVVNFPAALAGTNIYIAFVRVFTQSGTATGGDLWIIDDVNVVQRCLNPGPLTASNVGSTQANLSWTATPGAAGYQIEVLPSANSATGIATDNSTTNSFLKTGLSQNTDYKYFVRANCENGNFSEWVGPFNFRTVAIGTSCVDPIVITSLPFQTINNTSNFGNTLTGPQLTSCIVGGVNYQAGRDAFYSFTASESCLLSMRLASPQIGSSIFVYPSCAGITGACIAAAGNGTAAPRELSVPVVAGTTYIIVVS
ncbi:choice-of-anchor J domain-containing protein, partial [Microcoleus sp. herbarium8]|uniref:choice-of-anchor J domain-containing protein n=1 Tax=Microcoleus sp. herbarium8 TaxID=3055436 RepID=UPI002FD73454